MPSVVSSLTLSVLPRKVASHIEHPRGRGRRNLDPRGVFSCHYLHGGMFLWALRCLPLQQAGRHGKAVFMPFGHKVMWHGRESVPLTVSRPCSSVRHPLFHNFLQICGRWKLPSSLERKECAQMAFTVSRTAALQSLMEETKQFLKYMSIEPVKKSGSSGSPWIYGHFCHTLFPVLNMLADLCVLQLCSKLFFILFYI